MNVLIAGDYCPIGRTKKLIDNKIYGDMFNEIRSYIEQTDYSIVNLECPICLREYRPIYKHGPNLQARTTNAIEALSYAGFKMVTLANNHILDYGEEGLHDTMRTCKEYCIDTVGAGENLDAASQVYYKRIKNETLAIVNCCEHEFSIATETSGGSNPLNPIQQYYQIVEAKKHADYVLVIVHGGHEYFQLPSTRMKETYHFFVDVGADAVINHHQHCYTGMEIYNGKPIYYGLGNFLFDGTEKILSHWHEGFMVEIDFKRDNVITKEIPYIQCYKEPKVLILEDKTSFINKFQNFCNIIEDNEKLENEVEKYYKDSEKYLSDCFEPYTNRYMYKLRNLKLIPSVISKRKLTGFLNYIDCESHRDKLLYFLHKRNKE